MYWMILENGPQHHISPNFTNLIVILVFFFQPCCHRTTPSSSCRSDAAEREQSFASPRPGSVPTRAPFRWHGMHGTFRTAPVFRPCQIELHVTSPSTTVQSPTSPHVLPGLSDMVLAFRRDPRGFPCGKSPWVQNDTWNRSTRSTLLPGIFRSWNSSRMGSG